MRIHKIVVPALLVIGLSACGAGNSSDNAPAPKGCKEELADIENNHVNGTGWMEVTDPLDKPSRFSDCFKDVQRELPVWAEKRKIRFSTDVGMCGETLKCRFYYFGEN